MFQYLHKKSKTIASRIGLVTFFAFIANVALADPVDSFFQTKMQESGIPGLQVAIAKNNKIVKVASYGLANVQDNVEVDNTTVFNLASITKAFTSVAVMQLVEQETLDLSESIATYLPGLPKSWQKVTLQQLLSHTSGLPDIMNQRFHLIDSAGEAQSWLAVQKKEVLFEPGSAFHYNQTNYLLVGKILKQITGKSYAELIAAQQLSNKELALIQKAGFAHFHNVTAHQARNYRLNQQQELTNVLTSFPSIIRAGAGMSSNAQALLNWSLQLQNGEYLKNNASLDILFQATQLSDDKWYQENPSMHPYALGWYVVTSAKESKIVTAGGGQSALAVYPELGLSIAILTNLAGAKPENFMDDVAEFFIDDFGLPVELKKLKQQLQQRGYKHALAVGQNMQETENVTLTANDLHYFGNLLVKHQQYNQALEIFALNNQLHSEVLLTKQELDNYVGLYQLENFSINVSREANALFIKATGDVKLPIFAKTKTEFVLTAVDANISFTQNTNGDALELVLDINGERLVGSKILKD